MVKRDTDSTDPAYTIVYPAGWSDELRDAAKDVIAAWEKTGYSAGWMTASLERLKKALEDTE